MQVISKTNRESDILNLCKQFEDNFIDLNKKPKKGEKDGKSHSFKACSESFVSL